MSINASPTIPEEAVEMFLRATLRDSEISPDYDPTNADYLMPMWLVNDTLKDTDKFPQLTHSPQLPPELKADHVEITARIVALQLFERYLDLYSNPFVRTSIFAGAFYIVEGKIDTKSNQDREVWGNLSGEELLLQQKDPIRKPVGAACRHWAMTIAYLSKIAWFRSGHHLGGATLDGPLIRAIRNLFRIEGNLPEYVLQAIWHFAHLLDSRVACAHLGIIPVFEGCPPYDEELEVPQSVFIRATQVFPCGTTIVNTGHEIFSMLSNSKLACYYRDDEGTAERISILYRKIKPNRASFHPNAEILGMSCQSITILPQDIRVISAIAHVMFPVDTVNRWGDILPFSEVYNEPTYVHLSRALKHIQEGSASNLGINTERFRYMAIK